MREETPLATTRGSPHTAIKTQHSHKEINLKKKKTNTELQNALSKELTLVGTECGANDDTKHYQKQQNNQLTISGT